ncbi:MAG: hypothetical protein CMQ41_01420 [Gammaproteobacteria bacterium]|nr:hypothetical protein [Gammaproteobacteria bacterium]|tara:strand:+ start:242 stop:481 length:240 start_codon:yes stop_codon:yes gene_type:complete
MKKLCLLVTLLVSPVFAQEENPAVSQSAFDGNEEYTSSTVAMPDGSVWYQISDQNQVRIIYCHVNESGNPRCEEVDVDD